VCIFGHINDFVFVGREVVIQFSFTIASNKKANSDPRFVICKRKYYHFAGGEVLIAQKTGAPGAIPTRDLPLKSRIHEPFVFNSYEKA